MKLIRGILLIVIFIMMSFSMYQIYNFFLVINQDTPQGVFNLQNSKDLGIVQVNGTFLVVDGMVAPKEMADYASGVISPETPIMAMTYNEIRKYRYPDEFVTAYLKITGNLTNINGLLLEEIYSAANIYINGEKVASLGEISENGSPITLEKKSKLLLINPPNELELVIQVSNPEHIGGQLQKALFIGNYDQLFELWNNRIFLKYLHSVFYATMGLVLIGLFARNRKHLFLLTLGLAGVLNSYIIITYFEPFTIFSVKDNIYILNSYLQAFPTLVTQYLSALSIILYIREGRVYQYRNRFIPWTFGFLILGISLVIFAEQAADLFYISLLFGVMSFMFYALIKVGRRFVLGENRGIFLYTAFLTYIVSYGLLIAISLSNQSFGLLSQYHILLMTGQFAFYLTMSYYIVGDFSRRFYLTEVNENILEQVVKEKTVQLKASLESLEKVDVTRRQLLSDISHDLRSPITVIKGYVELINTGKINDNQKEHYMDVVSKKISYMSELVDDILYLARIDQGNVIKKEAERLDVILNEVIDNYRNQTHVIQSNIVENMPFECDYKQIKRLLANLIDNAIDYSPEGSRIKIESQVLRDYYKIEIQDEGIGIDPDKINNIFNRFIRVNGNKNNDTNHFGLGLAIVKSIVTSHQGTIDCESQIGMGTKFTIYFPRG